MAGVFGLNPFACSTLKNELIIDELATPLHQPHISEQKCGDILFISDGNFWFVCTFCDERFVNVVIFGNHIKDEHILEAERHDPLGLNAKERLTLESPIQMHSDEPEEQNEDEKIFKKADCEETDFVQTEPTVASSSPAEETPKNGSAILKCRDIEDLILEPSKKSPRKRNRKKKTYSCSDCQKEVSDRKTLMQHMRRHTGETPFQCEECGKFFKYLVNLKAHLIIHSGTRPFKCTFCEADFTHPASLRTHRFLHTGERPHKCENCEKAFVSTSSLKVHMRHHTGETPYSCDICGKGFSIKCHYDNHMRKERNQRDFRCEICGKAFYNKETLTRHMECHSDEKKFGCDVCEGRFNRRKTLVEHKKLHLPVKQYVCQVCSKDFAQYAGLYSHMKHHKSKE